MDTRPPTSEPHAEMHPAQHQTLISAADAFIAIAGELQVDTFHSWRTAVGDILIQKPELTNQAQGYALLLDDLLYKPGTCIAIVERLRAALHAINAGPDPDTS